MADNIIEIKTIDQILARAKRHGEPIMPILISQYFDHDLLEAYAGFEQQHHDLYDAEMEKEAYATFLEDKETGFYAADITFEEIYDNEFDDHFQLQILQSLLKQHRDQCSKSDEDFEYKFLIYIVDSVLENYHKVIKKETHENGDLSLTYIDGEISIFEFIMPPDESRQES